MYLLRIAFDGTEYAGFQRQKNANTVGEELLKALKKLFGSVENLTGCSRTDSGVHALDFTVSFDSAKKLYQKNIIKALNNYLPPDISVFDCTIVSDDFSARYDVSSKEYIYNIRTSSEKAPFYSRYSLYYPYNINIQKLNDAAKYLIGTYDFSSFMSAGSKITDATRTIFEAYFKEEAEFIRFHIKGDGFLYNMVRIIVGTLLEIEQGKKNISDIQKIIEQKNRIYAGKTVPAKGLFLYKVNYD